MICSVYNIKETVFHGEIYSRSGGKLIQKPHPAIKEISPQQWSEITIKLVAYTLRFFRRHYGSSDLIGRGEDTPVDSDVMLPGGYSAADISQEIVIRVLKGARKWDPDRHGELLDYMIGQVRSLTSQCIRSWPGKFEVGVEDSEEMSAEDLIDRIAAEEAKEERPDVHSPEVRMIEKELIDLVLNVAGTDSELEGLVSVFIENPDPRRRFIAERLGKDPEEVTNLLKRLRTKVLKAIRSQSKLLGEEGNER